MKQLYMTHMPPGYTPPSAATNVTDLDRKRSNYAAAEVAEKQAQSGDWTERTRAEQTTRSARRELESAEIQVRTEEASRRLDAGNKAPSLIRSDCGSALLLVNAPVACSQKPTAGNRGMVTMYAPTVPAHTAKN